MGRTPPPDKRSLVASTLRWLLSSAAGGRGGEVAATRLLREFLMGDLRMLSIGPRAAKKWRGSSKGQWKQRRQPQRPAVATTAAVTTTTTTFAIAKVICWHS